MEAGIFFDLRGLYGTLPLVDEIKGAISGALGEERRFLPFLARNALANRPSSSVFRRFLNERTGERRVFDLKRRGLRPLVEVARLFAMQAGYLDSANTSDRLRQARAALPDLGRTAETALDAHDYLTGFRMARHLEAIERGEEPENVVDRSTLSRTQQSMLDLIFSNIEEVQGDVAHRYGIAP
jgi:CBS domain-containing protein